MAHAISFEGNVTAAPIPAPAPIPNGLPAPVPVPTKAPALTKEEEVKLSKYSKMKKMKSPEAAIRNKMKQDGVDKALVAKFLAMHHPLLLLLPRAVYLHLDQKLRQSQNGRKI